MALLKEAQNMADTLGDWRLIANPLGERGGPLHAPAITAVQTSLDQAAGIAELAGDAGTAKT